MASLISQIRNRPASHDNPILDTYLYDVEFAGCKVATLTGNAIVRVMYTQCVPDRNEYVLPDELFDVKHMDNALMLDQQQITVNGRTLQLKSTKGLFICSQWKGGSITWEKLPYLKESHQV